MIPLAKERRISVNGAEFNQSTQFFQQNLPFNRIFLSYIVEIKSSHGAIQREQSLSNSSRSGIKSRRRHYWDWWRAIPAIPGGSAVEEIIPVSAFGVGLHPFECCTSFFASHVAAATALYLDSRSSLEYNARRCGESYLIWTAKTLANPAFTSCNFSTVLIKNNYRSAPANSAYRVTWFVPNKNDPLVSI